jgi:hypothetical protein
MSQDDDIECKYCGKVYTEIEYKWCQPCQINNLKQNFTNWTSGNEKIDELIQEMQLKSTWNDGIFEWIPYNQFNDIKEISKDESVIIYLATWVNGSLEYDEYGEIEWKRIPNKKVALKCLYNSKNISNEFLSEV